MKRQISIVFVFVAFFSMLSVVKAFAAITPGSTWYASGGAAINAHGGCVVFYNNTYYWFGEDRTKFVSNGVSCYKSTDLMTWTKIGVVFAHTGTASQDFNDFSTGRLMERPKVTYNESTKKWVLWGHWEKSETDYSSARVCVAISDKIEGPYTYYKTFRPNTHDSRDQTIFKDTDGKAYHICATDMNSSINVALMTDNYQDVTPTESKVLLGKRYEAPAIFKLGEIYFGLFSNCTGWDPNPGQTAYTTDVLGEWSDASNFCVDNLKDLSYKSQSTYVMKVNGYENAYVYMGDRWNSSNVESSTYVWLPLSMRSGYPAVRNYSSWDLSVFKDYDRFKRVKTIKADQTYQLLEKNSNRMVSKTGTNPIVGFAITNDSTINLKIQLVAVSPYSYKIKDSISGKFLENVFGSLRLGVESSSLTQQWFFQLKEDGYYNIVNQYIGSDGLKKVISISGSSTYNESNLYLDVLNGSSSQDFALYFDSNAYAFDVADIFSKKYREDNKAIMLEQSKLVGVASVKQWNEIKLFPTVGNGDLVIVSSGELTNEVLAVEVFNAISGEKKIHTTVSINAQKTALNLSDRLSEGLYLVKLIGSKCSFVQKIIVR